MSRRRSRGGRLRVSAGVRRARQAVRVERPRVGRRRRATERAACAARRRRRRNLGQRVSERRRRTELSPAASAEPASTRRSQIPPDRRLLRGCRPRWRLSLPVAAALAVRLRPGDRRRGQDVVQRLAAAATFDRLRNRARLPGRLLRSPAALSSLGWNDSAFGAFGHVGWNRDQLVGIWRRCLASRLGVALARRLHRRRRWRERQIVEILGSRPRAIRVSNGDHPTKVLQSVERLHRNEEPMPSQVSSAAGDCSACGSSTVVGHRARSAVPAAAVPDAG